MDSIDLDYTHLGDADLSAQASGIDELITGVQHSFGSDGKTLFVHVDLPDGITRIYAFTPGRPVPAGPDN